MYAPKVSVIIPTYNRPQLLRRALLSIYGQTYSDFEVIIINDGNEIDLEKIVAGYPGNRKPIFLKTRGNEGAARARNVGIAVAQGMYIAFLDDDDEWLSDKLAVQVKAFESVGENVGFSLTSVEGIGDDGVYFSTVKDGIFDFREDSLTDFNGFLTVTLLIRTEILKSINGFDESLPSHQDPELIIRITHAGYYGLAINRPLTRISTQTTRDSIGTNYQKRIIGRILLIEKHKTLYATRPYKLARLYFELGIWYRREDDLCNAQECMRQAWKLRPFYARYFLHMIHITLRRIVS